MMFAKRTATVCSKASFSLYYLEIKIFKLGLLGQ
jgi:hypothetical protein